MITVPSTLRAESRTNSPEPTALAAGLEGATLALKTPVFIENSVERRLAPSAHECSFPTAVLIPRALPWADMFCPCGTCIALDRLKARHQRLFPARQIDRQHTTGQQPQPQHGDDGEWDVGID